MLDYSLPGTIALPELSRERIAVFIPSLRGGGAERAMLLFAKGLVDEGRYDVDLIVAQAEGELLEQVPKEIRVVDLKHHRVSRALLPLVRYLRAAAPNALYASIVHANIIAVLAKKLARVSTKVIVRESNSPLSSPASSLSSRTALRLLPRAYAEAHAVIAVSEGVKNELLTLAPALRPKISVLPTPVVPAELDRLCSEKAPHPWLQEDRQPYILAVGRLHPQKDFETLICAFADVRSTRPLRLIILGEGPERTRLEELAERLDVSRDVSLPGFCSNPYPYFKNAEAFVLSSRYEGMPNVLIQALACGTPVIATDCPSGPREILGDSELGQLVPVGDRGALAQAVSRALSVRRLRGAAESVAQRFGVAASVRSYLNVAGLAA